MKSHMVIWAQFGEGFLTVCGIDDGCSEHFYENAELVDFGNEKETTCKKCLAGFKRLLTKHDKEVNSIFPPRLVFSPSANPAGSQT